MKPLKLCALPAAILGAGFALAPALGQLEVNPRPPRLPDVVYVPTPQPVVDAMLELAKVRRDEMVYDLGCGDGRAVITAASKFGARGIGVDIDPKRIEESLANAAAAGVNDRVQFKQEDLFEMDFSDADVLFLYLLPRLNVRLRPRILDETRPGTRVVSHSFSMAEWEPDQRAEVELKTIYFWIVPAKVGGEWKLALANGEQGTLTLDQQFQKVGGTLRIKDRSWPVTEGRLTGTKLTLVFGNDQEAGRLTADIDGGRFTGTARRGARAATESWTGERTR